MRHSPTNDRGVIADVKVIDVEKRRTKEHSNSKNYVRMNLPLIFAWFPRVSLSFHILYSPVICVKEILYMFT